MMPAAFLLELRIAARSLLRRPSFTVPAALTLSLGIGGAVAVFAIVDAVLLRPLPYPDPDELVTVLHSAPGLNMAELPNSEPSVRFYAEAKSFVATAAYRTTSVNLTGGERPERVRVGVLEPDMFRVLRVRPAQGRGFVADDAVPGPARVAILTHGTWRARFGGEEDVLGRTVLVDGHRLTVVGVMPEGFAFPEPEVQLLVPMTEDPAAQFGDFSVQMLARLAPGATVESARREVETMQPRLVAKFGEGTPKDFIERAQWSSTVLRYRDWLVEDVRATLWIVLGTVAFLLLIACANVANLFLVRAEDRGREIAVRAALGAGRRRLTATFVAEGLLLGLIGAAGGALLANLALEAFGPAAVERMPRLHDAGFGTAAIVAAALLALLTGFLFGIIPAARWLGRSFAVLLRDGGRTATEGRRRQTTRRVLVTAQVALALVLLTGSGLMLRSFWRLGAVETGVRQTGLLAVGVSLGSDTDAAAAHSAARDLRAAIAALPGVRMVGAGSHMPLVAGSMKGSNYAVEGTPDAEGERITPMVMYKAITPGYFEATGMPLVAGRLPVEGDAARDVVPVWVNESFAREASPDRELVGRRMALGDGEKGPWHEIAGIIGDTRDFSLRTEPRSIAYFPLAPGAPGSAELDLLQFAVATNGDAAALTPPVRDAIRRLRPELPVTRALTIEEAIRREMAGTSLTMAVLGVAAGAALLLGAVGIYAVIAYSVGRRRREIAIRMALGARGDQVRTMVIRDGLPPLIAGLALGLVGALALTRLMQAVLFETSATDPVTFAATTALLLAVALAASWLPARRAAALEPSEALRAE